MNFYRVSTGWSCEGQTLKTVADCLHFARRYWGVPVRCVFHRGEFKVDLA
jgi:hypothetical protein